MKINYDIKNKKVGVEADVEKLVEKGLDNNEKNWKEKFNAKKQLIQLKHQHKMEFENQKQKKKTKYELKLEEQKRQEQLLKEKEIQKEKKKVRNVSIILIFVFALFCMVGFKDGYIIAPIVSIIQICLLLLTIGICEDLIHLFKKDYKILFLLSILLIIVWFIFAV